MYSIRKLKLLINEGIDTIFDIVELELSEVMPGSFDDLIDLLDEALCEEPLPKVESVYKLIDIRPGFYCAGLKFFVSITIDVEQFKAEYEEY